MNKVCPKCNKKYIDTRRYDSMNTTTYIHKRTLVQYKNLPGYNRIDKFCEVKDKENE